MLDIPQQPTADEIESQEATRRKKLTVGTSLVEFFINHTECDPDTGVYTVDENISAEAVREVYPNFQHVLDGNFDPAECTGLRITPEEFLNVSEHLSRVVELPTVEQV